MPEPADYQFDLPDDGQIRQRLSFAVEMWMDRNKTIRDCRQMYAGENPIAAPQQAQYRVVVEHCFALTAAINEKASRYLALPEIAVIPADVGPRHRAVATELQNAINRAQEVMELRSDGNSWPKAVFDAILLDAGVERIEASPSAFWPELIVSKEDGKDGLLRLADAEDGDYEKMKEEYKRQMGLPMRAVYVPLEAFLPVYEGPTLVEAFELERRSLRSLMANRSFDTTMLAKYGDGSKDGGLSAQVTVLHYANAQYHAYYALAPGSGWQKQWPNASTPSKFNIGQPTFLYAYKHGVGQPIYNVTGGRFGGWKGANNRIEAINRAMLEINQDLDDLISQVATRVRNSHWNTYVAYYDQQLRGGDEQIPKAPVIQEGQNIGMWKGETLLPLVEPKPDPEAEWLYRVMSERLSQIAGAPSLFGQHQPGVSTGYHEQLQISQAEHLDNAIEANLAKGAVARAELILKHVVAMDEKVPVYHQALDPKGRPYGSYIDLDPRKLKPLPRLAAKVRAPRPQDTPVALQAMLQATSARPGSNLPLLSDETALQQYGGFENPDEEIRKVRIQEEQRSLIASGILQKEIAEKVNMLLVKEQAPNTGAQQGATADPALLAAAHGINAGGETEAMGGVNPARVEAAATGAAKQTIHPLNGLGGGTPEGMAQPNQTLARGQQVMQGG